MHGTSPYSCRPLGPREDPKAYPRTTYLQRWMHTSLARQYYAPKKLVTRGEQAIPCEICGGMRAASVAILGGQGVHSTDGGRIRLAGLSQMVVHACEGCMHAALGPQPTPSAAWTIMPLQTHPAHDVLGSADRG